MNLVKYRIPLSSLSFLFGLMFILIGWMLTMPESVSAQEETAEYIGSGECRSCHGTLARNHSTSAHSLALFSPVDNLEAVLGDFSQANDLLVVSLPNEETARQVQLEDIAYVVGAGIHVQRYLISTEEGQYQVLPFEWNSSTAAWQAYALPDESAYDWNANCAYCHSTGFDTANNTWLEEGVQCEACHGAGSIHLEVADDVEWIEDEEDLAEIQASINTAADAQVCGQCHSQGISSLGHVFPDSYQVGEDLLADFSLVPLNDISHWWQSGHANQPNMQFNEWSLSGHATAYSDLPLEERSNPLCLDCHNEGYRRAERLASSSDADVLPDPILESQRLAYGVTCNTCHNPHAEEGGETLLRDSADALCADCHTNGDLETIHHPTIEMLEGQSLLPEIAGVTSAHSTGENSPTCTSCHMMDVPTSSNEIRVSHNFSPVLPNEAQAGQADSCTSCHSDLTASYGQRFISSQQEDVSLRISNIESYLENQEAPQWVWDAVAFVRGDGSLGVHNVPYTESLLNSVEQELGLVAAYSPNTTTVLADPLECAECHQEEHNAWLASPHANASLQTEFQEAYAASGQPSYCLRCHASGYDPLVGNYRFEGVICTSCHLLEAGQEHPPAPINLANDSAVCGTCHSGGHASAYEEWLASEHYESGIDCIDCHTAHDNGLLLGDVNSTCGDCHANAMNDEVHMGEDMLCTDCHMTPRHDVIDPTMLTRTGHSMMIDPSVCSDCHGDVHLLSYVSQSDEESQSEVEVLNQQVEELSARADANLNSGLFGGAIGLLIVLVFAYIVLRLGRIL